MAITIEDRFVGCLLGLACGDAIGTTVEFKPRGSFEPMTDMIGGGPFDLEPGQWTDDTSMALCLAESLLYRGGFDPVDQMNRYVNWWQHGYLSATGECFDIGNATQQALARYLQNRDPFAGSTAPNSAGNGSLMRLAPIAMFYHPNVSNAVQFAAVSSRITHGASEAVECCMVLASMLHGLFSGNERDQITGLTQKDLSEPAVKGLLTFNYTSLKEADIKASGYCVESLKAAIWCFSTTTTFSDAVLKAVNLGDDADTTGAITGQIAGAYYGYKAIPEIWRARLTMSDYIETQARRLYRSQESAE
jgi:ADP-ribosyl-[dinitrogen reductase] hydrolase